MLPAPRPISELNLDRSLLHVFVAGAGRGEGIAVALPRRDWLLVDSCTNATGEVMIAACWDRWSQSHDRVQLLALSHPHDDHAEGFAELIQRCEPIAIAIAGVDGAPSYFDVLAASPPPAATDEALRERGVRAAMSGMRAWETQAGCAVQKIHEAPVPLLHADNVDVFVRSPAPAPLAEYLGRCVSSPAVAKAEANRYSLVFELCFGETRLVLPGDLPHTVGGRVVAPGWGGVIDAHPQLAGHVGFKVAHHGSAEAVHPVALPQASGVGRAWVATPFNSARLPRVAHMDGLPALVSRNGCVALTSLPASKAVQAVSPAPGRVSLPQLVSRQQVQPTGSRFIDAGAVKITPGSATGPLDAVWCVAFDDRGRVVDRYRGDCALDVVA